MDTEIRVREAAFAQYLRSGGRFDLKHAQQPAWRSRLYPVHRSDSRRRRSGPQAGNAWERSYPQEAIGSWNPAKAYRNVPLANPDAQSGGVTAAFARSARLPPACRYAPRTRRGCRVPDPGQDPC